MCVQNSTPELILGAAACLGGSQNIFLVQLVCRVLVGGVPEGSTGTLGRPAAVSSSWQQRVCAVHLGPGEVQQHGVNPLACW